MSEIDRAKSLADSYMDEIAATVEIRHAYSNIVVSNARSLFSAFSGDRKSREALQEALRYKTVDPSVLYKSLIIQTNGVFESYIRSLVKALIEERFETAETYLHLDDGFRRNHIAHASRILTHIKSGSIMGSSYNFDGLVLNVGKSFVGERGFKLNPEIYTKLMGNCTAARLEELFSALNLSPPFSDLLGRNAELKAYFADRAKGRVADRAREELDRQIDLRNNIVHGEMTRAVDLTELGSSMSFFKALIAALDDFVRI